MKLRQKLKVLKVYYRDNGLIETFRKLNFEAACVVNNLYPFQYRFPSLITIETGDLCNLRCNHCYLWHRSDSGNRGLMEYELFEKIIARISFLLKKAHRFNFASVEGLFHGRVFDMIDLVLKHNKYINIDFNTNGMLLDEHVIDELLKRKLYHFHISLDGCTKETVESFKNGVDFEKVISNIKMLRRRGGDKVCISAIFVAHKDNIAELLPYVDFCKDLGIDCIDITGFIAYVQEDLKRCLYSEDGLPQVGRLFAQAQKKAKEMGIDLIYRSTKLVPQGCTLDSTMYIDKNGNVVPCVLLSKKTHLALADRVGVTESIIWGNVLETDASAIWVGKTSVGFRGLLHERRLPGQCNLCALGYGVIC